jgi:hypothetical protein
MSELVTYFANRCPTNAPMGVMAYVNDQFSVRNARLRSRRHALIRGVIAAKGGY